MSTFAQELKTRMINHLSKNDENGYNELFGWSFSEVQKVTIEQIEKFFNEKNYLNLNLEDSISPEHPEFYKIRIRDSYYNERIYPILFPEYTKSYIEICEKRNQIKQKMTGDLILIDHSNKLGDFWNHIDEAVKVLYPLKLREDVVIGCFLESFVRQVGYSLKYEQHESFWNQLENLYNQVIIR